MEMWVLILHRKDGYIAHSVHLSEKTAREWLLCKQHDNEDADVLHLSLEVLYQIQRHLEVAQSW